MVIRAKRSQHSSKRSERSVITYLAMLGVLLATGIDISLPAFDEINAELGAGSRPSLIVTTYVVGIAAGQLVYGPLADRYGRRSTILSGLGLYLVGAVGCALAPSFGLLLWARVLWGLGAAAPAGLRSAIARDLYSGDAMARVNTIIMAVFLLGPIFIPLVGEGILSVSGWRAVFWVAVGVCLVGVVWCVRFGETLDPANRRDVSFGRLLVALKFIAKTRVTSGHMGAQVFFTAAFLIFLGSSQPVFDRIFGRADQFAMLFALIGLGTIPLLVINDRLIKRMGSRRVSLSSAGIAMVTSAVGAGVLALGGPMDRFWIWYLWLFAVASFNTITSPVIGAIALEPMGELAGTASSLMYCLSFAIGAGLAALFDAQIDQGLAPFLNGYALYMALGFALMVWAGSPE